MICKCPKCNAALEYQPGVNKMACMYCGSEFEIKEVMKEQAQHEKLQTIAKPQENIPNEMLQMDGDVYTCTSCGAELFVNAVEASTFCAYCGQPTIVYSRSSKEKMPDYILPFRITKEQAVEKIREKLRKGFFVPKEIKEFEIERVRGIYIPYFIYDIYYYDKQRLSGTVRTRVQNEKRYFIREADCTFHRVTCDATMRLNSESSQRLEPFDFQFLRNFEPGYLSGFYADRRDVDEDEMRNIALTRCMKLFNSEILKTIDATSIKMESMDPKYKIKKKIYAFLPAWFLTFRYQNQPYTILINGQSGKLVGGVPFQKSKVIILFIVIAIIASLVFTAICIPGVYVLLTERLHRNTVKTLISVFVGALLLFYGTGIGSFAAVIKNIRLTKAKKTDEYVKERQDKNE